MIPFSEEKLKVYPETPGVYLMKGKRGEVLYVGKANNIKQRLKQYFVPGGDGRPQIPFLMPKVFEIDTLSVRSEKEALILESNLIKEHKPKYNALLKDDKSYIALKIAKEEWPKVDIVRYRGQPKKDGLYFGPYSNSTAARRTLDLIHKIFPLRQCSNEEFSLRKRPCILWDMKRCIAPCVGKCTKDEYTEVLVKTVQFLRGQNKEILAEFYKEMERYSENLEYEAAQSTLEKIRHIEKTMEKQFVDRPLGEDVDAFGLFRRADEISVTQLSYRGGRLTGSRHFQFSEVADEDKELLETLIFGLYQEDTRGAKSIVLPQVLPEAKALSEVVKIPIHTPEKGALRTLVEMAEMNAEAQWAKERDQRGIIERTLLEMQEKFHLTAFPAKIEIFDTSHMNGTNPVACLVAFDEGRAAKERYRKFKIKEAKGGDDYAMMQEALDRRLLRGQSEGDLPDLIVVDGGKGHLALALRALQKLNIITVGVIALAKEGGLHTKGATQEQVFLPNVKDPLIFSRHSPILHFLQKMRDEAHRYTIGYQRLKRKKEMTTSALDSIPGIGPEKKRRLLRKFQSPAEVFRATREELEEIPGLSRRDIENLLAFNPQNPL